MKLEFFRQIFE